MNYKEKLNRITAFFFDVDGVLTDGKVLLHSSGEQLRSMSVKDGMAIREAIKNGYLVAIISGGKSQGLIERFKHLKIKDVYLACEDKKDALSDLVHIHELDTDSILYMGDDINDWEVMKEVGIASCPQDAVQEIKAIADYISHINGGQGCVRDVIEQTLKAQGKWAKY
jgi:3-deoxy-D-manno-octulosonate 8-phosphate phosphatase (KDO 8-P phosphatase)